MSRRTLLLMLMLVTGCTMDCIEPGLQSRNTSVNVDIQVYEDEVSKVHWVNSGEVINKDEKIEFTLSGSVNFCPLKEGSNPKKVIVPAAFCADGSKPNYSDGLIGNTDPDEEKSCGSIGFGNSESYSTRRYVNTGIKVNPGDRLRFNLVPRGITIDYDDPQGKGISFDDNCYKSKTGNDRAKIRDLLHGGKFFCGESSDKRTIVEFPNSNGEDMSKISKEEINKRRVLVGNGYTPYDNRVYFNENKSKKDPWMKGALLDLRRAKIGLNELCGAMYCGFHEIKKYSSYELNCYYQNICYNTKGVGEDCISSIRYKKYSKENKCDMYSHLKEVEDKLEESKKNGNGGLEQINIVPEAEESTSWAEALVAKIGNIDDQDNAKAAQCLPKERGANDDLLCSRISNNFEDFSLRLNHNYEISNEIEPGSNVMLAIASNGNYHLHKGGYNVEITRSCNFSDGKKLYMYLGDSPPRDLPSIRRNNSVKEVERLVKRVEDNVVYYTIDGSDLENEKSGKIYFGVDLDGIDKRDITDKNGKYYEDNKYTVCLFLNRKINNFISSNINKVFDFITREGEEGIKIPYEGYKKGLLQGIRSLLTLYIIFTVIGYVIGTIQLSKFDFIIRMLKIAFIVFAFSDKSWEFFGTILSSLFIKGSTYLVDSFSGYTGEENEKFAFLDLTAGVLFTEETWLKFLSLMLSGPFGFIAFLMILKATFIFLRCIISAVFKYVISTVLVAFLLSLAPLFIVFILFQQTKGLFDNWVKTLAHVSLQPVILFSFLSLLNQLMYSALYKLTNFSACYQCLISMKYLSYNLCLMKAILPIGYVPSNGVDIALNTGVKSGGYFAALPIDLVQVLIYLIVANAMEAFVSVSETMAQALFSSGYGVAQSVGYVARSASQAMLSNVGLDETTQYMIQSIKQRMGRDRTTVEIKQSQKRKGSQIN